MKLQKFENVDVIASLEAIMKQNTAFYQSDFDIDKQILQKAAVSPVPEDKRLLWFSRPSGTCCFRERDVFLKDTRQHNTWRFYGEQTRDTILAYAVELTGTEQEKIKGNLYELDYLQHFREVIEKSIPADNYTLIYEHGELTKPAGQSFDGDTDPQLGKFIRFEAQPNDSEALKSLLREQQKKRTPHTQGDFQLHIATLHDRRIEAEARRIVENVKGLGEPDSPEKTHCAVELSPYFVPLATDKDMERLLSMLPYKSLSLSTFPFRSEGLGHFPTSNFQPTRRSAGGRKYGKGTPFLCLLRNFLPLSLLHGKSDFAKAGQKKNAANCDVSNCFFYEETRELYSPVISLLASSIPFAVADRIFKSFSLMPLSMVSS